MLAILVAKVRVISRLPLCWADIADLVYRLSCSEKPASLVLANLSWAIT